MKHTARLRAPMRERERREERMSQPKARERPCGSKPALLGKAKDLLCFLLVDVLVLGHCESNLAPLRVVDSVKLLKKRDAEHEKRAVWGWHVELHQGERARATRLVDVVP